MPSYCSPKQVALLYVHYTNHPPKVKRLGYISQKSFQNFSAHILAHPQYIMKSGDWETTGTANNTTFPASLWSRLEVNDNVWNQEDWEHCTEKALLKEHAFPN